MTAHPTNDLPAIAHFLQAFAWKEDSLLSARLQEELPALQHFVNGYNAFERAATVLIETEAPKFNLFSILAISHLEAWVHTPLLAELLRPDGTHGQGRLFFDAFLAWLFGTAYLEGDFDSISVTTEQYEEGVGRMDMVLVYQREGVLHEVIIENKIYGPDGYKQLDRYLQHYQKKSRRESLNYYIVYLTPYSTMPAAHSIDPKIYKQLVTDKKLYCMGYHKDIAPLLQRLLDRIKAPVVLETVRQYLYTIETL